MRETAEDLDRLQALLDASYAAAGPHLRDVVTPDRRLTARAVSDLLIGVQVLDLATVSAAGRPLVGPVDGLLFRGRLYFGSSPDAVRTRHLRRNPAVSAAHTRGEALAVVAHGDARIVNLHVDEQAEFRACLLDTYVPRYGAGWETFASGAVYWRIDARRLFAASFPPPGPPEC